MFELAAAIEKILGKGYEVECFVEQKLVILIIGEIGDSFRFRITLTNSTMTRMLKEKAVNTCAATMASQYHQFKCQNFGVNNEELN